MIKVTKLLIYLLISWVTCSPPDGVDNTVIRKLLLCIYAVRCWSHNIAIPNKIVPCICTEHAFNITINS